MQYTIRNIPEALDAALRDRARQERKSLNEIMVQTLAEGIGFSLEKKRRRDLGDLAGTWREDPEFDSAIADQHRIDDELWS